MREFQLEFGKFLILKEDYVEDPISDWAGISTDWLHFEWIKIIDLVNNTITTPTLEDIVTIEKEYRKSNFATKENILFLWEIVKRLKGKWNKEQF